MIRPWYALRLEPARPAGDPDRGLRAELADPAWMIGRQWQLGELQGENASSPVDVAMSVHQLPIQPSVGRPQDDPTIVPAEAIVEAGAHDWWTPGRRLRLGRAAVAAGLADESARCGDLPPPYDVLNGIAFDGRALYALHPEADVFAEVPAPTADAWSTTELVYRTRFPCSGAELVVGGDPARVDWVGHDGGAVDWWTVDATTTPSLPDLPDAEAPHRFPQRFSWAGGPARRWWQLENHHVDLGGLPPDRAHLASTMLLDLVMGHSDDWFLVPVPGTAGHVLAIREVAVTDAFGDTWPTEGTSWPTIDDWSVFRVAGLGTMELPLWLTAASALAGDPIEEVAIGIDEDANLAWAVEERLAGQVTERAVAAPGAAAIHDDQADPGPPSDRRYQPISAVPAHWTPYTREPQHPAAGGPVMFRQGRLVEYDETGDPTRRPPPTAELLAAVGVHEIAPWRLPPTGIRLERRRMLARATDGSPRTWVQRRRVPLLELAGSGLMFDNTTPIDVG